MPLPSPEHIPDYPWKALEHDMSEKVKSCQEVDALVNASKAQAFDSICEYLKDSGFDIGILSYENIAEFIKNLALSGTEEFSRKLLQSTLDCYTKVAGVAAEFESEAQGSLSHFKGLLDGVRDMAEAISMIQKNVAQMDLRIKAKNKNIEDAVLGMRGFLDLVQRTGKRRDKNDDSAIASVFMTQADCDMLNGLSMLLKALESGKVKVQ